MGWIMSLGILRCCKRLCRLPSVRHAPQGQPCHFRHRVVTVVRDATRCRARHAIGRLSNLRACPITQIARPVPGLFREEPGHLGLERQGPLCCLEELAKRIYRQRSLRCRDTTLARKRTRFEAPATPSDALSDRTWSYRGRYDGRRRTRRSPIWCHISLRRNDMEYRWVYRGAEAAPSWFRANWGVPPRRPCAICPKGRRPWQQCTVAKRLPATGTVRAAPAVLIATASRLSDSSAWCALRGEGLPIRKQGIAPGHNQSDASMPDFRSLQRVQHFSPPASAVRPLGGPNVLPYTLPTCTDKLRVDPREGRAGHQMIRSALLLELPC